MGIDGVDLKRTMSNTDGAIVEGAVRRCEKRDIGAMVQETNLYLATGNAAGVIRSQWNMITALSKTIIHLEKQNLLMQKDYKRGRS